MTSFNPRLTVRRLLVKRGFQSVYDAALHPGLNIICGENSSGKSTLLDFLFYGLGGELTEWREVALACTEVVIEVELNGLPAVFSREISAQSGRPMRILLEGPSESGEWGVYPYKRSQNKESFSQVIFRLLSMPEVTGDANSNITMHQVLRLLYADQLSPVDRIFRFERFDTELTRQTVGDLLCGAYDNAMYRQQLRLREADKEYAAVTAEWRHAVAAFDRADHPVTLEWLDAERAILNQELDRTRAEAEALEQRIFSAEVSQGLSLDEQKHAYAAVVEAQQQLLGLRAERDALQLETADSQSFIDALEVKLDQLRDAASTADALKRMSFIYCPECFAPVDEQAGDHACALCKSPFDQERAKSRVLSIINETGLQLKQSRSLQDVRRMEAIELDVKVATATQKWNGLSERYKLLNRLPSTELRAQARTLYGRAGYLERQIEDLGQKASLIERIDALSMRRAELNAEMTELKEQIEGSERRQQEHLRRAYTLISDGAVSFLRQDLLRQDTFEKAANISFSFGGDRLAVNGESFFSASSMVYLRNSFFAGLLRAAIMDPKVRHPRFLVLDTIEDKGMEPERSHHFQDLLAEMSTGSTVEHQLIYATAMISPKLAGSKHVIDRFYTHEERTLSLSGM